MQTSDATAQINVFTADNQLTVVRHYTLRQTVHCLLATEKNAILLISFMLASLHQLGGKWVTSARRLAAETLPKDGTRSFLLTTVVTKSLLDSAKSHVIQAAGD
jgi:hypothetical protein